MSRECKHDRYRYQVCDAHLQSSTNAARVMDYHCRVERCYVGDLRVLVQSKREHDSCHPDILLDSSARPVLEVDATTADRFMLLCCAFRLLFAA